MPPPLDIGDNAGSLALSLCAELDARLHEVELKAGVIPEKADVLGDGDEVAHPWKVTIEGTTIKVASGKVRWYNSATKDYDVTALDEAAFTATLPTTSSSKVLYVKRVHDSGAVTTATISAGEAADEATANAMADDYTKVWIVAVLTADADDNITVDQRLFEDQEDGPDCRITGTMVLWNTTTPPHGWIICDGSNGTPNPGALHLAGYKASDGDYDQPGYGANSNGWTGFKWHGQTENNHNDHKLKHYHDLWTQRVDINGQPGTTPIGCAVFSVLMYDPTLPTPCDSDYLHWCDSNNLPSYDVPGADHRAKHYGPFNGFQDTDNRPRTFVTVIIWKL